jgi:hypothetical protein
LAKPTRQQAHAIIGIYKKLYESKYGHQPVINSYTLVYGFMDAIGDLGYADAKKAMEYYFTCDNHGHPVQNFLNKYTDLHKMRVEVEKDRVKRAKLLEETAEKVRRMEERNLGDNSGTSD